LAICLVLQTVVISPWIAQFLHDSASESVQFSTLVLALPASHRLPAPVCLAFSSLWAFAAGLARWSSAAYASLLA